MYDITNNKRILTSREGKRVKFLIPKGGGLKKCYLFADSKVNNVENLFPVNIDENPGYFTNYSSSEYKDVDYLLVTHKNLREVAIQYSDYRKETGYNPVVVTAKSLYEQFYYGVEMHPFAITNFAKYAKDNFADTIHGLFLFGKGYRAGETGENYRKTAIFIN